MVNKKFKQIFMYSLLNLFFIGFLTVGAVHAQSWPQSRISFVVGYAPGGSTDIAARIMAQQLTTKLGQTIVVENKPGVSGVVGSNIVAKSKPDGYTFLFGAGSLASGPSLMKSLPYDVMTDFVPVAQLTVIPTIVAVHPSVPAKNVKEFVDYVKANPGMVNYGSAGPGSLQHISGALFAKMIQGSMVHIPYKGGALANSDLVAGRVQVVFGPVVELMPFVTSGAIRVLGVTSLTRTASFPEARPVAEAVPGYEMSTWHGVFAPKGTSPEIVDAMNKAINAVLDDPSTKSRFISLGLDPVNSTQQEFTKFYFDEIKRWKELVNIAGAKQE
jgi:tripartite-type tricarboxylate transporter receptor subunit TctC